MSSQPCVLCILLPVRFAIDKCLKQLNDPDVWKFVLDICLNAHTNRRRAFIGLDFTDAINYSKHLNTTTI